MFKTNIIYNEDCLGEKGMCILPDKSVDMILCDLPYGTTKNKWDTILPFDELWKQYKRVVKQNGVIILFGQDKFTAKVMLSQEKIHKYNLIWEKDRPSGFLNAKRMPLRSHEDIMVFSESEHEDIMVFYQKAPLYNPQMTVGKKNNSMGKAVGKKQEVMNNYGDVVLNPNDNGELKYPRSVLKFPRPHPPIHPTQKPVELCEWLIKTFTQEGEIVLDNCIGSGTTAIACINTNRQYVGWEWKKENPTEYYDIIINRIKNHIIFDK
jgi:site-specific DNA-methyltransferase (adenine-specific)